MRLRNGFTQEKLGVAIGLDEGTATVRIGRYETGVHEPSFAVLDHLARVLKVPAPYFCCDDDVLAEAIYVMGQMTDATLAEAKNQLESLLAAQTDPQG